MRACRDLGWSSVVIYDPRDGYEATSLAVELADTAIALPSPEGATVHRSIDAIIAIALAEGCDGLHPGTGRLATDAAAAAAVLAAGLVWVGSAPDALRVLDAEAPEPEPGSLTAQVVVDDTGAHTIGYRETLLTRRSRAVAVSTSVPPAVAALDPVAAEAAERSGCRGLVSVRLAVDASGSWCVRSIRPALSPWHAVTEAQTRFDLVAAQLRIAFGLDSLLAPVRSRRFAYGFALSAEDARLGYLRTSGIVEGVEWPGGPGVRVDAAVGAVTAIGVRRHSVLARIAVFGIDRRQARERLTRVLDEVGVPGVTIVNDGWELLQSEREG